MPDENYFSVCVVGGEGLETVLCEEDLLVEGVRACLYGLIKIGESAEGLAVDVDIG